MQPDRSQADELLRAQRYQRLSRALKDADLKLTAQRSALCEVLARAESHPTAHEVFEEARRVQPGISLATVYNTLKVLQSLGLITEAGGAGDASLHYELNPEPHLNLVCLSCGRIQDLPPDQAVEGLLRSVRRGGYEIMGSSLVVYGHCPDCRARSASVAAPSQAESPEPR